MVAALIVFTGCTTDSKAAPLYAQAEQLLAAKGDVQGRTACKGGMSAAEQSRRRRKMGFRYRSHIVYQKAGNRNFLRVNEKTQTETAIIQHDESAGWVAAKPVFSPDGKKLAVFWNRHPDVGLWIISLEPYSETFVLAGYYFPFGWSPDEKYVYATRGREIIRVQTTVPNEIMSVAALSGNVAWGGEADSVNPNGREAIVSVGEEKSDVWLMENFDPLAMTRPQ